MPQSHKTLGQANPSATTATTLYTVPSAVQTVVSSLVVCNIGSSASTYRVSVRPAGASQTNAMYLAYDASIPGNDSVCLVLGIALAATDVVTVYAGNASLAFSLFGVEIT
jgi:hypothetical protein